MPAQPKPISDRVEGKPGGGKATRGGAKSSNDRAAGGPKTSAGRKSGDSFADAYFAPGERVSEQVWIICGLMILTVFTFLRSVTCGFVNFDDNNYITDNGYTRQGLTFNTFAHWLCHTHLGLWHPLTMISLSLDFSLFGLSPAPYHAENVAIHAANAVFLYLLLSRTTGASWRSGVVAAIFAVHPLRVESVAWIVERKDVLSTLFGLAAIDAYVQYARARRMVWLAATTGLMFLSLLAKPMLISLPAVLLLMDFWPLRRRALEPVGEDRDAPDGNIGRDENAGRSAKASADDSAARAVSRLNPSAPPSPSDRPSIPQLLAEKLPMVAIAIIVVLISQAMARRDLLDTNAAPANATGFGPLARFLNAIVAYARYLGMMAWFYRLAPFYPVPDRWPAWQVLLSGGILLAITAVSIVERKRRPWLLMGWGWYVVTLLPTAGFVAIGPYALADRYTYVPSIGILIMLAWSLPEKMWAAGGNRAISAAALGVVLLLMCAQTFVQCGYWFDSVRLWQHCVDVTGDNWLAQGNLAVALDTSGHQDLALPHYRSAAALNAGSAQAHLNLAIALMRLHHRPADVLPEIDRAIACDPLYAKAYWCRATLEDMARQVGPARDDYRRATEADPGDVNAFFAWADMERRAGNDQAALEKVTAGLQLDPTNTAGHTIYGEVLLKLNDLRGATDQFVYALRINPYNRDALIGLETIRRLTATPATHAPKAGAGDGAAPPGSHTNASSPLP